MTARFLATAILAPMTILGAAQAQEPVTVTDQTGEEIILDGPAERVVTVPMPAAAMFIAIDGSADRLAGMHQQSKAAIAEGILGEFFPGALDVPTDMIGTQFAPNVEEMLAVNPDLVFQWANRGADVISPMTDVGLDVIGLTYGSQEEAEEWIRIMGEVAGEEEKADRLIDWHRTTLADLQETVEAIPEEDRPTVLYLGRFLSELRAPGTGTYQAWAVEAAGGINPAAGLSGWTAVNIEQVLAWNPDVILLNNFEEGLDPQDVYDDPQMAGISAVENRRVYMMPLGGYRWDPPSHESPLSWHWLAMIIHGDAVDYPIREEIKESYGWIYGQTPTEEQIDEILRVDMNGQSAGYERFES